MIAGAAMIIAAMAVAYSIMANSPAGISGEDLFPAPESMFDNVSEQVTIDSGNAYSFSYTANTGQVPLMWGLHILDYNNDDSVAISISNIFGDKFGSFTESDPIFIKSFTVPKADSYNFNVQNNGKSSITVKMMFTENPEKSKALTDPNSPFVKNILPLATAGFLLIIGIIVIISGTILAVVDWKRGKNQSRYI